MPSENASNNNEKGPRDWLLLGCYFSYLLCLALPAYKTNNNGGQLHIGLEALMTGSLGVLVMQFSWFANPILWWSWAMHRKQFNNRAIAGTVIALGLSVSFMFYSEVPVGSAGIYEFSLQPGYFVWILSIALSAIAACWSERRKLVSM